MRWYGAWVMPGGLVQTITAQTLPRAESRLMHASDESTYEVMTDPVRASWPSR